MKVLNKINSNHIELNKLKIRFFIQGTANIMGLFKGIFLPFCLKVFLLASFMERANIETIQYD